MNKRSTLIVGETQYGSHETLQVSRGWNDEIARELVEVSRQPHIRATTPRDASERFVNLESAHAWFENSRKQPIVYTMRLGELGNALSGLIWFSRQNHPDAHGFAYTSGFRLYEGAVGRGLARPFAEIAHNDFSDINPQDGVWLETNADNTPAVKLYGRLGYETVAERAGRLIMTWRPDER